MIQRNDHDLICEQQIKNQQQYLQDHYECKQQHLSLSDISPMWAMRLKEKQSPLFLVSLTRLRWLSEIIHPKKCVVAEAYGFSSSYTDDCRICARFGNKFSLYFAMHFPKKLEENQQRFIKHWNEKHL